MLRTARYGLSARNTEEPENAADATLNNSLMLKGALQNPAVVPSIRGIRGNGGSISLTPTIASGLI